MKLSVALLSSLVLIAITKNSCAQSIRKRIAEKLAHRLQENDSDQKNGINNKMFKSNKVTSQSNIKFGAESAQTFDI